MTVNRARKQREAVAAIEALGGYVAYDYQVDGTGMFGMLLPKAKPPAPKWLRELIGEEYFVSVVYAYFWAALTDADLEHLKGLNNLHWLYLRDTQVTDAGLVHLKGLTNLQRLSLLNSQVTDEGVKNLQQALPNCKIIR